MKTITNSLIAAFAAVGLTWFAFSSAPNAFGVTPAPDGGYPNNNTAEGTAALKSLTTGTDNTAAGAYALNSNTTGVFNTANGSLALFSNTTGDSNTAIGGGALGFNTTGSYNTAVGDGALDANTTGDYNTAIGHAALVGSADSASTGSNNTATGDSALSFNATGNNNTASGVDALQFNHIGNNNTATGSNALGSNYDGNNNTAEGFQALVNNTTGSNNIALGANAGINLTSGHNNIVIGASGTAGESNTIRIGKDGVHKAAYMGGIRGATVASGVTVIVGASGHLGTIVSSQRFKEAIEPMDKASEAILALEPVTFRYKHELDPEGIPQFGLVAEQVEKVNPDLVARDEEGKAYTVRYEAVNAMLLNEFLKEHRKVQKLEATVAEQQKQIEILTAVVQKVSDQMELKPAAQRVADTR